MLGDFEENIGGRQRNVGLALTATAEGGDRLQCDDSNAATTYKLYTSQNSLHPLQLL